jgi:hypothetical protein
MQNIKSERFQWKGINMLFKVFINLDLVIMIWDRWIK